MERELAILYASVSAIEADVLVRVLARDPDAPSSPPPDDVVHPIGLPSQEQVWLGQGEDKQQDKVRRIRNQASGGRREGSCAFLLCPIS